MRPRSALIGYSVTAACFLALVICAFTQAHVLASVFTVLGILGLAYADLRGIFVLAYPVVSLIGAIVSVSVIESGAYISEQWRNGFNIGAAPLLGLYALGFLTVAHAGMTFFTRKMRAITLNTRLLVMAVAALSIAVGVFYAFVFLAYGLGLGFRTRFDWVNTMPGAVSSVHALVRSYVIPVLFALVGIIWGTQGLKKNAGWIATALLPAVALVGTGEKFSAFSTIVCMLCTGIGLAAYLRAKPLTIRRLYLGVGAILVALIAVSLAFGYLRQAPDTIWRAVTQRIALQGHVWFGIWDNFRGAPGVNLGELLRENQHDAPAGLDLLSYVVSRHDFVYERIGRGISFTMGGPPGALAALGTVPGMIAYALLGLLYVGVLMLALYFLRREPILAVIPLAIYMLVGTATQMGFWDALYGPVAIFGYVAAIAATVYVVTRRRRSRLRSAKT